ncbi:GAF domain-containing protein [Natranaerovirga pectinivora]|uniref:GAF domain-containing protein n=1 Tax=Natranaerovirga pectinivora TaxID=682400 RepID=A0A4R3MNP6_9FIRM|nr:GAF domain-containing protein [Natranaerovirga pectinivora]TCT15664.1 GAF domain-containing protein [Natranaerovirga pectinivora]
MTLEEKNNIYEILVSQVKEIIKDEPDVIANMANISSILYNGLKDVNWAGFYIWKKDQLVLGPFQGKPACIRIPKGKGVCGTAVLKKESQIVENVHNFPGHIACDSASNSEIVIPIIKEEKVLGVLDIDSPNYNRFDEIDEKFLKVVVALLLKECKWDNE